MTVMKKLQARYPRVRKGTAVGMAMTTARPSPIRWPLGDHVLKGNAL